MSVRLLHGDCRDLLPTLPEASVHCVVTSPPYWGLRDYGVAGQLGLEATPEAYLAQMVGVFRAVRRVLRDDGTLWCNMGDSYLANQGAGFDTNGDGGVRKAAAASPKINRPDWLKPKDLVGMPWRLAFALQADGWYLRADIIWAKPNPMPESVTDRPTKAHEYVFLLTKSARYFYDADAVREPATRGYDGENGGRQRHVLPVPTPRAGTTVAHAGLAGNTFNPAGRNLRSVWTIPTEPTPEAHFATFPPALASRCIQAGSSEKGCCTACGAPWAREVERAVAPRALHNKRTTTLVGDDVNDMRYHNVGGQRYQNWLDAHPPQTTGWAPTCACAAPVAPCTVLDPFAGSGTTGQVAEQLGRHSILIELSPAYVAMARERTAQCGLFTHAAAMIA